MELKCQKKTRKKPENKIGWDKSEDIRKKKEIPKFLGHVQKLQNKRIFEKAKDFSANNSVEITEGQSINWVEKKPTNFGLKYGSIKSVRDMSNG